MRLIYICGDVAASLIGLVLFSIARYLFRPEISELYGGYTAFLESHGVLLTLMFFPPFMLLVSYLTGYYMRVESKSRVDEAIRTLLAVGIGTLAYFFVALLNDRMPMRRIQYELMLMFAGSLFVTVWPVRFIITTLIKRHRAKQPLKRYLLLCPADDVTPPGQELIEVCHRYGIEIGEIRALGNDIKPGEFDGVVLAPSAIGSEEMQRAVHSLYSLNVPVMVSPDDRTVLLGTVTRFDHVIEEPLVDITAPYLPDAVMAIKRFTDVVVSAVGLLVFSPVIAVLALIIKMQSAGPVFYSQERIGYHRKPFMIHKLRSMVVDSEADGPSLSSDDDPRITSVGRFMRKYRLDELPNLWNVLVGEMSLVGPRPEREYYIRRIVQRAPHYTLLHLVRPGLTSWGMVRYGYASDVDQMLRRLRYDILYIQNLSLEVDLKIAFYTLRTILRGEGK